MQPTTQATGCDYDVVIVGGGVSGTSVAWLLRQWLPQLPGARVLIVERAERFGRRVGEATVEVSGHFLSRVLGLYDELSRNHLPKHGLRYWFADRPDRSLFEMSEVGPNRLPTMPSFQLDRARLDEYLLQRAAETGIEVMRPAQVKDVELGWPVTTVRIASEGAERCVTCRWFVDASGRAGLLAKRLNLREPVPEHATSAAWARWRGVKDMDSAAFVDQRCAMGCVKDRVKDRLPKVFPSRRLATNHFSGLGWWCWVIPLAGGETSIGVVYDTRLFDLPAAGKPIERFEAFARSQPGLRDLLADAEIDGDDFLAYKDLAYRCKQYVDRGWALVGDAAAFLDPLYSPGLDNVAFTSYATASLIRDDLLGKLDDAQLAHRVDTHNRRFTISYQRWMRGIYLDKYHIFGDPELVAAAYCFDIGTYYLGVVAAAYRDVDNLTIPPLGVDGIGVNLAYALLRCFKHRTVRLGKLRRRIGFASPRLTGWRYFPTNFELGAPAGKLVFTGIRILIGAELQTLRYRFFGRGLANRTGSAKPQAAPTQPVAQPTDMM